MALPKNGVYKTKPGPKEPTVMTPEKIGELKKAFAMSLTDKQACFFAGISESTFYDYCSKHKDFAELKELLKEQPSIKAKANLLRQINEGDDHTSKRRLERKSRDEFSLKTETELTGKDGKDLFSTVKVVIEK